MSLVINNNMMAASTARILGNTYDRLSASTQRLSSGLRINGAADDAAGLAIRELMRADIATMQQGIRNAADGISMLQTAEGGMAVIDEKLVRMKELAEQAATGTYTTVQREIINSEYQAMAAEIDRIATATEFNGVKLLDGSMSGIHQGLGLKIHFGTGNSQAEDYYFIQVGDVRATSQTGLRIGGDAKNDIWGTVGTHGGPNTTGCCGGGIPSLNEPVPGWKSGEVFAFGYNWDWKENDDEQLKSGRYLAGAYQADSTPTLQELLDMVNKGSQARVRLDFQYTNQISQRTASGEVLSYYYVDNNLPSGKSRVDVPLDKIFYTATGSAMTSAFSYQSGGVTISVPARLVVYSANAHMTGPEWIYPRPVNLPVTALSASGHISLNIPGGPGNILVTSSRLTASATAANGLGYVFSSSIGVTAVQAVPPRIDNGTTVFPPTTLGIRYDSADNTWRTAAGSSVTFAGNWTNPGSPVTSAEPRYIIGSTIYRISDVVTGLGWDGSRYVSAATANLTGASAVVTTSAPSITFVSGRFPPAALSASLTWDSTNSCWRTAGPNNSAVTFHGQWSPAGTTAADSPYYEISSGGTTNRVYMSSLTTAGGLGLTLDALHSRWVTLGTTPVTATPETAASFTINDPLIPGSLAVTFDQIEFGSFLDTAGTPVNYRLKPDLVQVDDATTVYEVDSFSVSPGYAYTTSGAGPISIGSTLSSPPNTVTGGWMSALNLICPLSAEAVDLVTETRMVSQPVFLDASGAQYLLQTDNVKQDALGYYVVKDPTKPTELTRVNPDMISTSGGVTLAQLLNQASAANSAYSAATVVADDAGAWHYLWSSAGLAAANSAVKSQGVTASAMEALLGALGYSSLADAIAASAIMINPAYSAGNTKNQTDYHGQSAVILVPSVSGGAHRVCLGDEIYYIGSAGLGASSFDKGKTAAAVSLSALVSSAAFWNSKANPFGSGRNWETIWAASALAYAINNNPNSRFWARLETGGAGEYREGFTSLYVYCKEGGDKHDVKGCDEQLGDVRTCVEQYSKIVWYNDEMETGTSAGTYFNNGGKDWGTLRAVPTGYGSWGVQLHGRDIGKQRDLWILNVGAQKNADIQTDPRKAFTGQGFGTYSDGTGLSNLLGLDRQAFVEIQNADDGAWAGAHVRTQSDAQESLDAIQAAIERKDKVRATLGAYINRLENTITNLEIQAENLQASESRISDVDMATEMTNFVKNQVLTQAAISMLSQANSLPQMALSLLNG